MKRQLLDATRRVLAATIDRREGTFTIVELSEESGVGRTTVRTIINRRREWFELVERKESKLRGGREQVWRIRRGRLPRVIEHLNERYGSARVEPSPIPPKLRVALRRLTEDLPAAGSQSERDAILHDVEAILQSGTSAQASDGRASVTSETAILARRAAQFLLETVRPEVGRDRELLETGTLLARRMNIVAEEGAPVLHRYRAEVVSRISELKLRVVLLPAVTCAVEASSVFAQTGALPVGRLRDEIVRDTSPQFAQYVDQLLTSVLSSSPASPGLRRSNVSNPNIVWFAAHGHAPATKAPDRRESERRRTPILKASSELVRFVSTCQPMAARRLLVRMSRCDSVVTLKLRETARRLFDDVDIIDNADVFLVRRELPDLERAYVLVYESLATFQRDHADFEHFGRLRARAEHCFVLADSETTAHVAPPVPTKPAREPESARPHDAADGVDVEEARIAPEDMGNELYAKEFFDTSRFTLVKQSQDASLSMQGI